MRSSKFAVKIIYFLFMSLLISACQISGDAQKGPFLNGAAIKAVRLSDNFSSTTRVNQGNISSNSGGYSVKARWRGWTQLEVSGEYFNEYDSSNDGPISIQALINKTRRFQNANINIYTHLITARAKFLVANKNKNKALRQAHKDLNNLLEIKGLPNVRNGGASSLNISDGKGRYRRANAHLLLFSGAFNASKSGQNGLDVITRDFADDGLFNGIGQVIFIQMQSKAGKKVF